MPKLVIVESPTKAKTLRRFLGDEYIVESSVGHVRDLPPNADAIPAHMKKEKWARLGVNVDDDFKPLYVVHPDKKAKIKELKALLAESSELLLATDEDREGEAISWHLLELLKPTVPVKRMVFHEITKTAIFKALEETRDIDMQIVRAQEARRIIDRLYGYEVSPILWRKIRPKLSAGRVQSIAIRMVVEREQKRLSFVSADYWGITAQLKTAEGKTFEARLATVDGKSLATGKDFDPDTGKLQKTERLHLLGQEATTLVAALGANKATVISTKETPTTRQPAAPFTTSTLQQEGNRKLRFGADRIMRAAQSLYENGFITYMRTDSVNLSGEALESTRTEIETLYGKEYLPDEIRTYKNKSKNAQEAHEAIRPVGSPFPRVADVTAKLGPDAGKIYELIWKRTMGSQMANAKGRRMTVKAKSSWSEREAIFSASGTTIDFAGFLKAYEEGSDEPDQDQDDEKKERLLPPVTEGESLGAEDVTPKESTTQPPARLTEASLVKALEESGVGRPSTYASIIKTIMRRDYTFKKGNALVPTWLAFAVVKLLHDHMTHLIDYTFTASMEDRLDEIARGEGESIPYLREFYFGNGVMGLKPLLEKSVDEIDPRTVCSIKLATDSQGRDVIVRVGRWGPYLQRGDERASLPDGLAPDELDLEMAEALLEAGARAEEPIGTDPESGEPIYVKTGRYGPYVQLGNAKDEDGKPKKEKPKMVSLLADMSPETIDLETALKLLTLPRMLGQDADGNDIEVFNGRYGPYLKAGKETRSLTEDDHLLTIGLERALKLLAEPKKRGRAAQKSIKEFEDVEALDGKTVKLLKGRYGPYVTDGETNASLPRGYVNPEELKVEEAIELILARRAAGPKKKKKAKKKAAKKKTKKKATKKKAAKKKTTKKKAAKKKTTKKKAAKKTAEASEESASEAAPSAEAASEAPPSSGETASEAE
ncbi:MAG: type I DNA topoisomerase [Planctomycetes bacterium]|nr:type I DNA topoisomerase [Planctomycetota bacterium]